VPRARSALAPKWSIIQNGKLVGAVTHVILLCGAKSGAAEGGVKKKEGVALFFIFGY